MANPEHVANLNAGVHDWNKWRKENPVLGEDLRRGGVKEFEQHKIDLRHARLEKRDLRGFDLSFARSASRYSVAFGYLRNGSDS